MTDAEILKALECCMDIDKIKGCKELGCPLAKHCKKDIYALEKASLDLINRQKAEIERLKKDKYIIKDGVLELLPRTDIEEIKSEARKEFAERFRKTMTATSKTISGYCKYIVTDDEIDNLLEEMEG